MAEGPGTHISGSIVTEVAGETLVLMPQRAVYWPGRSTLLIADVHLGKADAARAVGAPVSERVLSSMLRKQLEPLSGAIRASGCERVLILGDLLHAPIGITESLLTAVAEWRSTICARIQVVPGNHDRKLARAAERWGMDVLDVHVNEGPFHFTHIPCEPCAPAEFVWCGHLHPAISLARGGDALHLPAFHLSGRVGVLPAFTPYARGKQMRVAREDQLFAIADGRVIDFRVASAGEHPRGLKNLSRPHADR